MAARDLFAVYAVDLMRSMAALLNVASTTFFRAAALLQHYVAENGSNIQPKDYLQDGVVVLAGAALFAVSKVDGPRISMSTLLQVVHTVRQRRFLAKGAVATVVLEPPAQILEELRRTVVQCEWALLEGAGFTTTCEVPHAVALIAVRALTRTAGTPAAVAEGGAARDEFESQENQWLDATLALCTDAARSRSLTTDVDAPVVAAAAIRVAADLTFGESFTGLQPGWHRVVVGDGFDDMYDAAVVELRRVIAEANPAQLLEELARPKPVSPVMRPVSTAPVPLHSYPRPAFPGMPPSQYIPPVTIQLNLKELRAARPARDRSRERKSKSAKRSRSKSARKKSKDKDKKEKRDKEEKREKKEKRDGDRKEKRDKA